MMRGAHAVICQREMEGNTAQIILIRASGEVMAFGEISASGAESLAADLLMIAQEIRAEDGERRPLNS